ncbi:heavy-metal-associated domain-containing protein [Paenirhodobacter sp.]|uniref:heavy-metal-associated domain-containing protein n=1 Tax=Paenirhodobacter sp. TaxID=1965326 RepID=UPI003B3F5109
MKFHVPDMSCGGCLRSVTKALTVLDEGARVTADLEARVISVETTAAVPAVLAALSEAGFPATEA